MSRAVQLSRASAAQPYFEGLSPVLEAVERLASESGIEERGAIYTKREVVDFILDLVGYTTDKPLANYRLLEPSFGDGDFIIPTLERLLASASKEKNGLSFERLENAIRGVELHRETFERNRMSMRSLMLEYRIKPSLADALLDQWLLQGDFLLCDFDLKFTHAVGNPPYLRQEAVPDVLINAYRERFTTIYDRADIYVPFIEHALGLLDLNGKLSFICADRWMKNRYGRKLRKLVSESYALTTYVDMVDTDAFHSDVSAYPAITVLERNADNSRSYATRISARPCINKKALSQLAKTLVSQPLCKSQNKVVEASGIASGEQPWVLENFDALSLVRRLEANFPTLEEAGCKVGIGVATGADNAFIGEYEQIDVEADRKLPIIMTKDIAEGQINWRGKGVINPFSNEGKLVRLADYPRLKGYLEKRYEAIAGRHVARKSPHNWYRTIDRIYPELVKCPKLLIPDIKGDASIIYDDGQYYPHHNLYYVTSNEWNLQALQAILRSGIARLFVSLYSTKMRGGYLRFQAQYLRRICIPRWSSIDKSLKARLMRASTLDDANEINDIVADLYGLSIDEISLIQNRA